MCGAWWRSERSRRVVRARRCVLRRRRRVLFVPKRGHGARFSATVRGWAPPLTESVRDSSATVRTLCAQKGPRCVIKYAPTAIICQQSTHRDARTTHRRRLFNQQSTHRQVKSRTDRDFWPTKYAPSDQNYAPTAVLGQESTHRRAQSTHRPQFWGIKVRTVATVRSWAPPLTESVRTVGVTVRTLLPENGPRCVEEYAPTAVSGQQSTHRRAQSTHRPPLSANKVRTVGSKLRTDRGFGA